MKKLELLAPAGDMECLKTAFKFGADAVYIGGPFMQLRSSVTGFSLENISEAVEYAHSLNKKLYVTVNSFAKEPEFSEGKAISEISIYESEARAGAKLKQSITFADKKFNGKYVETSVTEDGRYYDKYTCDNGKFQIDNNDNLCSVKIYLDKDSEKELLDIFKGNSESITKEQATEYAKKYINDNLAEYSDYDIIDVVEVDIGHKYDYFSVEIGKRYGDFIGERGSIKVLRNGDVLEWSIYYLDKFDDFDKTKAEKLSFKSKDGVFVVNRPQAESFVGVSRVKVIIPDYIRLGFICDKQFILLFCQCKFKLDFFWHNKAISFKELSSFDLSFFTSLP